MKALGVDIGGSGIKAAVVDIHEGEFVGKRKRIVTPQPATPEAVTDVVVELVRLHEWDGPVGIAFPGVITRGVVRTAANLDPGWIDLDAVTHLRKATGCHVHVINDADAAGLGEARFGGLPDDEVVLFLTLGTGIGSALIVDGDLVANTELGHLELHGGDAERYAAESVREREGLSDAQWAARLSEYLQALENLLWPDRFVLGGGISKDPGPWLPLVECRTPVQVAKLANRAGIIGAAYSAAHEHPHRRKGD